MQNKIPNICRAYSQAIVFSDLDGTLLDHDSYSHAPAAQALTELKQRAIAVVLNTSKTFAEVLQWRLSLSLDEPFIVENGAAIYVPIKNRWQIRHHHCVDDYYVIELATKRQDWIERTADIAAEFAAETEFFHSMSASRLMQLTGLQHEQALLALQRQFAEPVLWTGCDSRKQAFISTCQGIGATVLQGGRFLHIGDNTDKGKAMLRLLDMLAVAQSSQQYMSIALGDGGNDIAMLEQADIAVRIASKSGQTLHLKQQANIIDSTELGPSGWQQSMQSILQKLPDSFNQG